MKVLLTGRLATRGGQSECELMARRTPAADPGRYRYTDPVIISAPGHLPEGEYTLHFENISVPVLHKRGTWTVSALPPEPMALAEKPNGNANPAIRPGPIATARRLIRERRRKK